jgi:hypothetical protein
MNNMFSPKLDKCLADIQYLGKVTFIFRYIGNH